MKLSSLFLRKTTTLAPCLLALAWLAAACSDDKTENPPVTPPPDSSTPVSDGAVPPPPDLDAGTIMCGSNTCSSTFVGGSLGVACCAGTGGTRCGLNFTGTCVDQSDAGFPTPPPSDAGLVPDPSCGTVSITVMGMAYPLNGCCMPSGTCGWYTPVMMGLGCLSGDQLRQGGATVPDAPIACSPDGGTNL